MASIPEATPGLVFRYDFVRPREAALGIDRGKHRPACVILVLEAGDALPGTIFINDGKQKMLATYVANAGDVVIVPIQSDKPSEDQLGVVLDLDTKRYIGLPADRVSYAIVSEVNVDRWPNAGIEPIEGKPGRWSYPRPMPGPKLAAIAKRFLQLRQRLLLSVVVRQS